MARHMLTEKGRSVALHAGHDPPSMSIAIAMGSAKSRSNTTNKITRNGFTAPILVAGEP